MSIKEYTYLYQHKYFSVINEYKSTAKTKTSASCLRSVCPHIIMQQSLGRNISL